MIVVNENREICTFTRPSIKDYCPGKMDLTQRAIVPCLYKNNPELAASREIQQNFGVESLKELQLPQDQPGEVLSVEPEFVSKFYTDCKETPKRCWNWVFEVKWHSSFPISYKNEELESVEWLSIEEIERRIDSGADICPDSIIAFRKWVEFDKERTQVRDERNIVLNHRKLKAELQSQVEVLVGTLNEVKKLTEEALETSTKDEEKRQLLLKSQRQIEATLK